jgi:hypothetical protein
MLHMLHMLQMFQAFVQNVSSVSDVCLQVFWSGCCICFTYMLQEYVSYVSVLYVQQVFLCCKLCFIWKLHMLQEHAGQTGQHALARRSSRCMRPLAASGAGSSSMCIRQDRHGSWVFGRGLESGRLDASHAEIKVTKQPLIDVKIHRVTHLFYLFLVEMTLKWWVHAGRSGSLVVDNLTCLSEWLAGNWYCY